MRRQLCGAMAVLALSGCANSERLMDAGVRPSDHADCLVGAGPAEPVPRGAAPSMRSRRCNPDEGLNWTIGSSRSETVDVDFKKKHD
ncbi:MAG: hypothetical protein ACN6OU_08020 [Stenotrophomonas acidaminiphila]